MERDVFISCIAVTVSPEFLLNKSDTLLSNVTIWFRVRFPAASNVLKVEEKLSVRTKVSFITPIIYASPPSPPS